MKERKYEDDRVFYRIMFANEYEEIWDKKNEVKCGEMERIKGIASSKKRKY